MTADPSQPLRDGLNRGKTIGRIFADEQLAPAVGYRCRLTGKTDPSVHLYSPARRSETVWEAPAFPHIHMW